MPSPADVAVALFSFLGIAVPIVAALYVGTRMAERKIQGALCCLAAFSVLLAGWAVALPTAFALDNTRCGGQHGCSTLQGDRGD